MDKLDRVLSPLADVLSNNKYLRSMANGLIAVMPLTMIASIFYLINSIPQIFGIKFSDEVSSAILLPYNFLFGILGLACSFTIAYEHSKNYKELKPMLSGLVSMVTFLLIAAPLADGNLSASYLGYAGIFTAIIVALVSVQIFHVLIEHKIRIKMPDAVPPMVSNSFEAMIPLFIILGGFYLLNVFIESTTGQIIPAWIQGAIAPAIKGADSWQYQAILHLLMQLFFWLGMHGWAICAGFSMPIQTTLLSEQVAAYTAGQPLPHITAGCWNWANMVMVVPIALLLFCKAERNRAIGKLALIPSLFGISEPYQFGVPIVMNPILGIPYVLYQPILVIISYFLVYSGIWPRTAIEANGAIPMPFSAFIATGNWMAFIIFPILLALSLAIWYPFVKVWDRKCLKEEMEIKEKEKLAAESKKAAA